MAILPCLFRRLGCYRFNVLLSHNYFLLWGQHATSSGFRHKGVSYAITVAELVDRIPISCEIAEGGALPDWACLIARPLT